MAFVQRTVDELQPLIEKPKLKPKLLNRPPFRFLHDICTNLRKSTGFLEGTIPPELNDGKSLKDKNERARFLNMVIKATEHAIGRQIDVSIPKILAGEGAEGTNGWLTALAEAGRLAQGGNINMNEINGLVQSGSPVQPRGSEPAPTPNPTPAPSRPNPSSHAPPSGPPLDEFAPQPGEEYWQTTARLCSPIFHRPSMKEKLLKRPPFRYIHDIVSAVGKATGFLQGYFPAELQDGKALKANPDRLRYLDMLIEIVSAAVNPDLKHQVQSINIAKGLNPEDTNLLIQHVIVAAKTSSTEEAVRKLNGGGPTGPPGGAQPEIPRPGSGRGRRRPDPETSHNDPPQRSRPAGIPGLNLGEVKKKEEEENKAFNPESTGLSNALLQNNEQEKNGGPPVQSGPIPHASTLGRPKTARRAPPRVENAHIVQDEHKKPDQDNKPSGVMLEGDVNEPDSGDEEENKEPEDDWGLGFEKKDDDGALTRQIKEQMEKENTGIKFDRVGSLRPNAKQGANNKLFARENLRSLQKQVQKLCHSANPLGKCMEFIFEDVDAMNKELAKWKNLYADYTTTLDRERKETAGMLEDLEEQVKQQNEEIHSQVDKVHTLKAQIMRNEETINQFIERKSSMG